MSASTVGRFRVVKRMQPRVDERERAGRVCWSCQTCYGARVVGDLKTRRLRESLRGGQQALQILRLF